jgi:predicted nuclease with RNAse H fold
MITVGIDLAAGAKKTGVAWVQWSAGSAQVTNLQLGADDDELVEAMSSVDKTGIDCPLGWPAEFIQFISRHQNGHVEIEPGVLAADWRRRLAYRLTDLEVKKLPGIQGLSVSADRIGITTMRCAALLSRLAAAGRTVERSGTGPVVEVYPAASLAKWGLTHKGYKSKKGLAGLGHLVDELTCRASWLDLGPYESLCRTSDDAFDAVIASLTARAAAIDLIDPIPAEHLAVAAVEGWIALPSDGLDLLAS